MTEDEQRIAIAEACGIPADQIYSRCQCGSPTCFTTHFIAPDYLNDLNAMHDAENWLSRDLQFEYHNHIFDIVPCDENHGCTGVDGDTEDIMTPSGFTMLHATARQRSEAFLKTVGKWKS